MSDETGTWCFTKGDVNALKMSRRTWQNSERLLCACSQMKSRWSGRTFLRHREEQDGAQGHLSDEEEVHDHVDGGHGGS